MQMMHDMLTQKDLFILKDLYKVYCKHCRGTWFHL